MAVKKFNETSVVGEMVKGFQTDINAILEAEDVLMFTNRYVECMIRFLAFAKAKDVHAVIEIKELNTDKNFLFGLAADYHAPEDESEEMPGNWTVTASMEEADIKETEKNTIVYDLQNDLFVSKMIAFMKQYAGVEFNETAYLRQMMAETFKVLKQHCYFNAKNSTEPYELDCGLYTIRTIFENDKFTSDIELGGELKQIIKDDAALENIAIPGDTVVA